MPSAVGNERPLMVTVPDPAALNSKLALDWFVVIELPDNVICPGLKLPDVVDKLPVSDKSPVSVVLPLT